MSKEKESLVFLKYNAEEEYKYTSLCVLRYIAALEDESTKHTSIIAGLFVVIASGVVPLAIYLLTQT